jgi:hypothetical protein
VYLFCEVRGGGRRKEEGGGRRKKPWHRQGRAEGGSGWRAEGGDTSIKYFTQSIKS